MESGDGPEPITEPITGGEASRTRWAWEGLQGPVEPTTLPFAKLDLGEGLQSAWRSEVSRSPSLSPTGPTSPGEPPVGPTMRSPVVLRLMEAMVQEEIAGLGECLSVCAQRSRTLKLLGFQHLHFDARLQGFLESRAGTVLRPVTDALLLTRSFFAFREAARYSFLWRRLTRHQGERQRAAKHLADVAEERRGERGNRKEHVARLLTRAAEEFLRLSLCEWARAVLEAKFLRCSTRLEELSEEHAMERSEKEALREKHVRECLRKYSSLLGVMQGQCFTAWKSAVEEGRNRQRRQQRLKRNFFDASAALVESVVQAWVQLTQENRYLRKRQELLREQKLREVTRILRTGILQGVELYCVIQAWYQRMVTGRSTQRQKGKTMEALARLSSDLLGLSFNAWSAACQAQQAGKSQRAQLVQKTVMMGQQADVAAAFAAWSKGMEMKKRKQQMAQHMLSSQKQLLQLALGAWRRSAKIFKDRWKRGDALAERGFAKNRRCALAEQFLEWKNLAHRERKRLLMLQLERARGVLKTSGRLKLKSALQNDEHCVSRMLLCWHFLASDQSNIQKERRRLARVAGLGRACAVRARCRMQQQRVLLAWLMICKIRPPPEKPGTFILKSLSSQPQVLALPPRSPSPVRFVTVEAVEKAEPMESPKDADAAAAAAAAAWLQAEDPSSPSRFRVTTSPTHNDRYSLACKAATDDGDYRQLLEHHRRELREQREAARRGSPERVQWGVWAK